MEKRCKRRLRKQISAIVLILAMSVMMCGVGVFASSVEEVRAISAPHFTIVVDGEKKIFYNAQGDEVHPIVYNGTTYLPLRAIGELMDKNVNWDQSSKTVSLYGERTVDDVDGVRDKDAEQRIIYVQIRPDFTIMLDDVKCKFADEDGNVVYPMLYEGTTYLPLRAIGKLMNADVEWDGSTSTVTLTNDNKNDDLLVTDADTFIDDATPDGYLSSNDNRPTKPDYDIDHERDEDKNKKKNNNGVIGVNAAKTYALKHAGLDERDVTFVEAKRDDNVYEVEFYDEDYKEYDYEIDAYTGEILDFDYEAEYYEHKVKKEKSSDNNKSDKEGKYIESSEAKRIALRDAGFNKNDVDSLECEFDYDDGRAEYNVEFEYGDTEYEYEIDALTGEIISAEID